VLGEGHISLSTSGYVLVDDCMALAINDFALILSSLLLACQSVDSRYSKVGSVMFSRMREDIKAIIDRDPAAKGWLEVVLCYPSFHVIQTHRLAKWFWQRKLYLIGRWISQVGRSLTGIEIHPGATIGRRFFIDHGMGVVIGEFAEVGDDVTLYHGVTLGGTSPSVDSASQRGKKRHPTLGNCVIVGSGAQILGPVTVGDFARVGANAVVISDVAERTNVIAPLAKPVQIARAEQKSLDSFVAYGIPTDGLEELGNEPVDAERLKAQLKLMKARLSAIEDKLPTSRGVPVTDEAVSDTPSDNQPLV